MNWRKGILLALLVLPIIGLLAYGFGRDPMEIPFVLKDKPAPAFRAQSLTGSEIDFAAFKGKPVILNFWSTWCEPCKAEHELLQQAAQYYGERVVFLGVVYQDQAEAARKYLSRRTSVFTQLMDPDSRVAMDFGVSGVPETYLVDPAGIVRGKHAGVMTGELMRSWLDPLVGAP